MKQLEGVQLINPNQNEINGFLCNEDKSSYLFPDAFVLEDISGNQKHGSNLFVNRLRSE